ncbi:serine/threonine-protein phosphatase 5-like [Zerene cesonia]|uniref:serine/threonine-protein phosphatase 5-like n=1 Tax=Zerene cesonia TaxID=33412 RepID=UPI0018E4DB77|nr:serine/threonine-protein phosphatase 5-like [Zerene cesonia]
MAENEELTGPVSQEDLEAAEKFKNEANEYFKKQNYISAIELYTKAIEKNPKSAVYYANRSICNLRLENFGYALTDASQAISLDHTYTKAYYRRAAAYMSLGKYKNALKDFHYVTKVRPNDQDAKLKYNECNKIAKKIAFEKAIAVDKKEVNIADAINLDAMTIEDEYEGPSLEDGQVTVKFVTELMEYYKNQKKLHKKYAYKILLDVKAYLQKQPSLVDITVGDEEKFTICGDIHGQYYDLMNIFKLNGLPSESNPYLFNGDFVDRGSFSVECIFTLFSFKLLYPNHFFMSRGNHETVDMNRVYGFRGEVTYKYSSQMADLFTEVYRWLPLAHCINSKVLVMHGGLFSKDDVTLDDIRNVERNKEPPEDVLQLVSPRLRDHLLAAVATYNKKNPQNKLNSNDLNIPGKPTPIYISEHLSPANKFLHAATRIKAKNLGYSDAMGNLGAFITMNGKDLKPNFTSYEAVPHPDVKAMAYADSVLSMFY